MISVNSDVEPKEAIRKLLGKHPEGLLITEIARATKMNRLTVAKYIHELIGEGRVVQRKLGKARLCLLVRK
ncbi:MAG: helix-turn-helix domain-containing protein [Candidatus Aenigmatarchaeota archaeon]